MRAKFQLELFKVSYMIRDMMQLVCFVRVINRNGKRLNNNVQQFVFAGEPVLMPQKHLKQFKKFMVSLLYIVLQYFIGTTHFKKGENRFIMSREVEDC